MPARDMTLTSSFQHIGRVRLTCLPIVMTSQWSAAHLRRAHLKAQTCDVLQREEKAKAGTVGHGRNREEPAHTNPEGRPNQRYKTWHGNTIQVNMDEPVGAESVAHGPGRYRTGSRQQGRDPMRRRWHTWARPNPECTWLHSCRRTDHGLK